jgi:hypothetical protein
VTGRTPGTYYYQIRAVDSVMTPSGWVVGGNGCKVAIPAEMVSPVDGSVITGSSATFNWTNVGADQYQLYVGSTLGAGDYYVNPVSTATSVTVTNKLPTVSSTIYVRLYSNYGTQWIYNDYTYIVEPKSKMLTPAPGSLIADSSVVIFNWTNVGADKYQLYIGSTLGGGNYYINAASTATSVTVTNKLPTVSSTIYVRLYTNYGTQWIYNDYIYTVSPKAKILTPVPSSVIIGSSATFNWTSVSADKYQLYVGSTLGGGDYYISAASTANSVAVTNKLPTDNSTIFVRLYSNYGTQWLFNDYTYTAVPALKATMLTPAPSSVITGPSTTFNWTNIGADRYQIYVGSTLGGGDYMISTASTATTVTVTNKLPTNGSTIFVRMYSNYGTQWLFNDYTYTAVPNVVLTLATMVSPANNAVITGPSETFNWTDVGADRYQIYVGSTLGGSDYLISTASTATSVAVTNKLPTNGSTIFVRLYSNYGTQGLFNDYTYTAVP